MIAYGEHEFKLLKRQDDGATLRDHLLAAERAGATVPELEGPPLPACLAYLWAWFVELSSARGGTGMGGVNPIGYQELAAWAGLRGISPTPFELEAIRRLDEALLRSQADGGHRGGHQHRDHGAR